MSQRKQELIAKPIHFHLLGRRPHIHGPSKDLLRLKTAKTYISIGYDKENNLLGFKVFSKKEPGTAVVEELKVYATGTSVDVIYAFSTFDKIPAIPRDGSYKFLIKEGEDGVFYVDLAKGKKNPKAKSKAAK